jgi:protein-disulfide isomerase
MKQKTLFIIVLIALFSVFVIGTLLYHAKPDNTVPPVPQVGPAISAGATKAVPPPQIDRTALMRMHSPSAGKNDAPVVIVEFFDPACEACRAFYPVVKEILAANPDKIRLVLRYTPLHKGSDKIIAVLEAARKQGKFWPVLEALLGAQAAWTPNHTAQVDLVWKHLEGLGLDLNQLRADMAAPEIAKIIAQDIEDGRALGISGTPSFFVNGQPLTDFGFEQLKELTNKALKETQRR